MLDIVTPTIYHYDYAMKAIEKGLHFFIEKPVTKTLQEAEEILYKCRENGRTQVGHVETTGLHWCERLHQKPDVYRNSQIGRV